MSNDEELLELLATEARRKSALERIPADYADRLAEVRANHVEREAAGPRAARSWGTQRTPYRVARLLLDSDAGL